MARDMIAANTKLFSGLEEYCQKRGEYLDRPGRARYIAGDLETDKYIRELNLLAKIQFGYHRSLLFLKKEATLYIGLIGFDFADAPEYWFEDDVNSGALVVMLTEAEAQPYASPATVRNFVDASDMSEEHYSGHDPTAASLLFPTTRIFEASAEVDEESVWRTLFELCVQECVAGSSWIQDGFARELSVLCDLGISSMPYRALCQSIFDMDPRSMFMALYRCIEVTYAYEACRKLAMILPGQIKWDELARSLDEQLKWRPRESDSLTAILAYAKANDLREICRVLLKDSPHQERSSASLVKASSSAIYDLRNRIVHFGLSHKTVVFTDIEWNVLCSAMVGIVFDVFTTAFEETGAALIET